MSNSIKEELISALAGMVFDHCEDEGYECFSSGATFKARAMRILVGLNILRQEDDDIDGGRMVSGKWNWTKYSPWARKDGADLVEVEDQEQSVDQKEIDEITKEALELSRKCEAAARFHGAVMGCLELPDAEIRAALKSAIENFRSEL